MDQDRLYNFGMMYSNDGDPTQFKEAYQRVKDDPWGSLNNAWNILRGRQIDRENLNKQGVKNIQTLEAAVASRMPFFNGLPITIAYHGSALYGAPVKNDLDYLIVIDPNHVYSGVVTDAYELNTQLDDELVRKGVFPDSVIIENGGIRNLRFRYCDDTKYSTALDISLFTLSVPIFGYDTYARIHQQYMELLNMDQELLVVTATIQEEALQYRLSRWGLSDEFLE